VTGQSNAAADRSASLIREPAKVATYKNRVWPVRTVDEILKQELYSHEFRQQRYAERGGGEWVQNNAQELALEVVRLRQENSELRARIVEK